MLLCSTPPTPHAAKKIEADREEAGFRSVRWNTTRRGIPDGLPPRLFIRARHRGLEQPRSLLLTIVTWPEHSRNTISELMDNEVREALQAFD